MLTTELILPRLKKQGKEVIPLILPNDYHALKIANELIRLVKAYVGKSRSELEDALRSYEGDSLEYPIIRGLAHILLSRCHFSNIPTINPTELRTALFNKGPVTRQNSQLRHQVVVETATQFKLTPQEVEQALFADLLEERILLGFEIIPSPSELIARYNLEVARGLLYWAREVDILVRDGYKDLFKFIKLFKLMYTIYPLPQQGYNIILHGPISPFVKSTQRYGVQFAKFLPAILLCQTWRMDATIHPPRARQSFHYTLDDRTSLVSHFKASRFFDSQLEADFAAEFQQKYQGARRKWELTREDEVILVGDTVMIPDFSFTHKKDGRRALIEIIGFWHHDYLQRKLQKVRQAQREDLILLIYKSAHVATGVFENISAGEVLIFNQKPVLKEVLAAVERCAKI